MSLAHDDDHIQLAFRYTVGTGAIGYGILFMLEGDHTLGRNESRMGILSAAKDYAKLHIILHYLAEFLADSQHGMRVYPLTLIGDDDAGRRLRTQMQQVGMCTDGIGLREGTATQFSVCFQYPDSSGGNITTAHSASSFVTPEAITAFMSGLTCHGRLLVIAAPEVPLAARLQLLREGRARNAYNVAAVLSSEVSEFVQLGGVQLTDLLALNMDEARAACGPGHKVTSSYDIVWHCVEVMKQYNTDISLSITDGSNGSYLCKNGDVEMIPSFPTRIVGSAGAGDAYLSGMLIGMSCGLPLTKSRNDQFFGETPLQSATEMGVLLASFALTTPDSIHLGANRTALWNYSQQYHLDLSPSFESALTSSHAIG